MEDIPVKNVSDVVENQDDLIFEEQISLDPYNLKLWLRYLDSKTGSPINVRIVIYERALRMLPGSYKLWYRYITEIKMKLRHKPLNHPLYEIINNLYERSLVYMNKMPVFWIEYCTFLVNQKKITKTRRTFDRALQSLPVTQHDRIWSLYLKFVDECGVWETAVKVHKRYLDFDSSHRERYIDFLKSINKISDACEEMSILLNDDDFHSIKGKSKHELWLELANLLATNARKVSKLPVDAIIRSGINRYKDETGRLWCSLAGYYTRCGEFEKAKDIYEEAIEKVLTVRDFGMVFESYSEFEQNLIQSELNEGNEDEEDEDEENDSYILDPDTPSIDLRIAQLEHLIERRPLLLSSVVLRQNPNNVEEWEKRVKLFTEPTEIIMCYAEAVKTIDPQKCIGKLQSLWINFAKYYEENGDIENADIIFEKATKVNYKKVDNLAEVWCNWAEMHIRQEDYDKALDLMKQAVREPSSHELNIAKQKQLPNEKLPVELRLYRSSRLWSFYVDLEESLGTLETTKAAYNRMIDLKCATPQIILNYAKLLEDNKYFEDSFRVYEKGVAMFKFPHSREIWLSYLTKFMNRYGDRKLERARDLFEECIEQVPSEYAKQFYLLYADLEDKYGLIRHCMSILDRSTSAVSDKDRCEVYKYYIKKVEENFGVLKTREIYEKAINNLPDDEAKEMCLEFARLETKLGEIDRARVLYSHCAQFCDPRTVLTFWKEWKEFEAAHGNTDTFTEMLRVKRSVELSKS